MPNIRHAMMGAAGVSSDPFPETGGQLWAWGKNSYRTMGNR